MNEKTVSGWQGILLACAMLSAVALFVVTVSMAQDTPLREQSPLAGEQLQQGQGISMTMSLRTLSGDQVEYGDVSNTIVIQYQDDSTYSILTEDLWSRNAAAKARRFVRNEYATISESYDSGGQVTSQVILTHTVALPEVLERDTLPRDALLDLRDPVISGGELADLLQQGAISEIGVITVLGRPAKRYLVQIGEFPVDHYEIWVDVTTGLKMRTERFDSTGARTLYSASAIDESPVFDEDAFEFERWNDKISTETITRPFNLSDGNVYPPSAVGIILPISTTLSSGETLGEPVYVTSTVRAGTSVEENERAWMVAQSVYSDSVVAALIVQAPEGAHVPGHLQTEYWPSYWAGQDPSAEAPSVFVSRTLVTLGSGHVASLFELADSEEVSSWHAPVLCRMLATWVTTENIRVMACEVAGRSSAVFVDLLNAFVMAE